MFSCPEVTAALARRQVRVRLKVAGLFPGSDAWSDIITEVSARLTADFLAQAMQDEATMTRWQRALSVPLDSEDVRQRAALRLSIHSQHYGLYDSEVLQRGFHTAGDVKRLNLARRSSVFIGCGVMERISFISVGNEANRIRYSRTSK
jgi:hypothetical protein